MTLPLPQIAYAMLLVPALLCGCGTGLSQLVPPGGTMVAEVQGTTARLRVFTMPPAQTPRLKGVMVVYVELHNRSAQSLRVDYPDLWLGGPRLQVPPLRPGDVLRPAGLPAAQRRLLASVMPGTLFGRSREPPPRPEALADWDNGGSALDFFSPSARTRANNHWTMRNDYDTGMQLRTADWRFFGLPRPGGSMSLFDILASTLPDGVLLGGATSGGFLFFPLSAKDFVESGLHWDVHEVLSDDPVETLSLPLRLGS